jgi:hypothetical protein
MVKSSDICQLPGESGHYQGVRNIMDKNIRQRQIDHNIITPVKQIEE